MSLLILHRQQIALLVTKNHIHMAGSLIGANYS